MSEFTKRYSPGAIVKEIDNSQYDLMSDYSLPNAPVVLATGFANLGEDYSVQWINEKNTFIQKYGYPLTEAEKYLYLAVSDVLNRGGLVEVAKLPYANASKDKYSYITYQLGNICSTNDKFKEITLIDNSLRNYCKIDALTNDNNIKNTGKCTLSTYDDLITNRQSASTLKNNLIKFIDITRQKYTTTDFNTVSSIVKTDDGSIKHEWSTTNDCLGIIPIITTVTNALYVQNIVSASLSSTEYVTYLTLISMSNDIKRLANKYSVNIPYELNTISKMRYIVEQILNNIGLEYSDMNTIRQIEILLNKIIELDGSTSYNAIKSLQLVSPDSSIELSVLTNVTNTNINDHLYMKFLSFDKSDVTVSLIVANNFPLISWKSMTELDHTHMKDVGVVVLRAFTDAANNNTINFEVLETYVGSLDRNAKSENGASRYICQLVNANSKYVNMFARVDPSFLLKIDFFVAQDNVATSMGFYLIECEKDISYTESILNPLTQILEKTKNTNEYNIDIVLDAGMSNIALFINKNNRYAIDDIPLRDDSERYLKWKAIINKFDTFCKNDRKDCVFLADSPRNICLNGLSKIVRNTRPENTIKKTIIPGMRLITGTNSSYTAGYCNWFYVVNDITGEFIWCPPSIKCGGIYTYIDTYFHKWDAPAGMNRAKINDAYDIAFNPTDDEAGQLYILSWNYAVNYPVDGILIEGQKTFQTNKTALDRMSVRRLMLYLEKNVMQIGRKILYEGNTEYLRLKFVDTIRPVFDKAKSGDGLVDYAIRCDDTNNTIETIERNELHIAFAVKPVKSIEWIYVDMICTNQSANVQEEVMK